MDDARDLAVSAGGEDLLVPLLASLIAIPSVNPILAPDEGAGEMEIAAFATAWLAERGVRARIDDVAPGRANVVADVGPGDGPTLVLCAHLDTVGTAGMEIPPFVPRSDGTRMYGRGACDMKGSVAAIMAALARLADRDAGIRHGRVVAALVADEEHGSLGAVDFVRRYSADACIVTEPADSQLVLAHKGFVWADIVTAGVAAHGSRWDLGVSAIGKMAPIIAALEAFDRQELRRRTHPLVGPASLHCALISGGVGLSTYAPECRLQVERRTLPGETADQVERELRQLVGGVADSDARVTVTFSREPSVCDPGSKVATVVRDAVTRVTGTAPRDTGVPFWMDAAIFSAAGIPTVNYGPAGAGAHATVEWVDLPSVRRLADVLVEAARQFTRASGAARPAAP